MVTLGRTFLVAIVTFLGENAWPIFFANLLIMIMELEFCRWCHCRGQHWSGQHSIHSHTLTALYADWTKGHWHSLSGTYSTRYCYIHNKLYLFPLLLMNVLYFLLFEKIFLFENVGGRVDFYC